MNFSKNHLLASGFTAKELQMLQNNIDNFGGTFEEVVRDLAKKFKVFISIFIFTIISFSLILYFKWSDSWYVFSCAISFVMIDLIILFINPPVISYKSWRFCREKKN
ncbi:hypothetical protein [Serratia plymuthica]|uniref:hypothetical protein n=1 Tax=Serratia plymuthica TaxID=82996 RepID=UPI0018D65329|nr:hypothetical protein [Serratia plymuthica]QPS53602.1 hypothetical protein I6G53_12825 [Serratia plymuthica]CAI1604140.1 Uncharacterised protein [Serratia plymuthica]